MPRRAYFVLFLLGLFPGISLAQQTDVQKLGQRIFEQRCPICHTRPTIESRQYAVTLSKDVVAGNEDSIREIIRNGIPEEMPGFKYGLEPSQIDAVIEYLKTVPKPQQESSGKKASQNN